MTLNPLTREGVRGQLALAARRRLPLPLFPLGKETTKLGADGWDARSRPLTAIIIIFTRPRVIKAACYTCSVGGY